MTISASSFDENITTDSVVATLSSTDQDLGDTHIYSLVSGDGATDNSAFTIDGDKLKINTFPDYETQNSYSVRLRATDSGGLSLEKAFTFAVNDLNEDPTNLSISASTFDENITIDSVVAILSSTDQDLGDTHIYSLVSGDGATDNSAFTVNGNQLTSMHSTMKIRMLTQSDSDRRFRWSDLCEDFVLYVNLDWSLVDFNEFELENLSDINDLGFETLGKNKKFKWDELDYAELTEDFQKPLTGPRSTLKKRCNTITSI